MLLSYRDPQFWKKFYAEHWLPRVPTVIGQPFKVFPFSEETLLQAMKAFEVGVRGGDLRSTCLLSVGDSEKAPRRPLKELFRQPSGSMAELEQNISRVFSKQNFGLMVTHFQAVDPGIWSAITAFLQDARHCVDFPVPRAFLDLFYGNYSSSFTGLHKDTQEILAFVVKGEKRILTWPFDYFLSKVEGLTPAAKYFHMRLDIDYRKYRKDALVLEARAGDMFYWPSDRWHVAEAQPGHFSAMISLGLFRPDAVPPKQSPDRFREKLMSASSKALRSQEMTKVVTKPDAARALRWVTGFGFELGGPIAENPAGKPHEAQASVTVVKKKNSLVLWKVDQAHLRILVATNGHSITLGHSSRLVRLLEQICRGELVTVSHSRPLKRGDGAKVFETNWNKRCELKTRKLLSLRDPGAHLVDWLLRVHAVERKGVGKRCARDLFS